MNRRADDLLARARHAVQERAWSSAFRSLRDAASHAPLDPADLERLATCACLVGRDDVSADAWARAHQERLRANDPRGAARCAFWLILQLLSARETARAGGWLATALRLVRDDPGCAEHGLLLVLTSRAHLRDGEVEAACEAAAAAARVADRLTDCDLKAFGRLAEGLALAARGDPHAAVARFDEAMVAVTATGVSPVTVGTVYCAVIEACYELLDLARAREWTEALSRWCGTQPEMVAFRGQCLVHRAETMRLQGAWSSAVEEAGHACRGPSHDTAALDASDAAAHPRTAAYPTGAAHYELAEIHRMRGEFGAAEEEYRQASLHGRQPEPGLALLRLAQGRTEQAAAAIRRALDERQKRMTRAAVLAAAVDVMLAISDLPTARRAADALSAMARELTTPFLRALSAYASGTLLLAEGLPSEALNELRRAWMEWQTIDVPYEAARTRVAMGLACRALHDADGGDLELEAARAVLVRLGAAPEIARIDRLRGSGPSHAGGPLTARELEVIRLVAKGRTNRAIARALAISERTVDRHVSNILMKLDLSSRSQATAYAYEHGLV